MTHKYAFKVSFFKKARFNKTYNSIFSETDFPFKSQNCKLIDGM